MISTLDIQSTTPGKPPLVGSIRIAAITQWVMRRCSSLHAETSACMPFDRRDRRDVRCWVERTIETANSFGQLGARIKCADAMAWTVVRNRLFNTIRDAVRKGGDSCRSVRDIDTYYDRRREIESVEPCSTISQAEEILELVLKGVRKTLCRRCMRESSLLKCVARVGWQVQNYAQFDPVVYSHFVESLDRFLESADLLSQEGHRFVISILNRLNASSGNNKTDLENAGIGPPDRHAWNCFKQACDDSQNSGCSATATTTQVK